jgi:hypothetical protein
VPVPKAAAGAFDVELVPAAALPAAKPPARGGFSRRDLVLFGIGVGGTLLAIGFAWLLAHLFG